MQRMSWREGVGDRVEKGIWQTESKRLLKSLVSPWSASGERKNLTSLPASRRWSVHKSPTGAKWKGYTRNCRYDKSLWSHSLSKRFDSRMWWWIMNQSRPILNTWYCLIYVCMWRVKPELIPFSFCLRDIFFFFFQKCITLSPALVFCVRGCVCLYVEVAVRILSTQKKGWCVLKMMIVPGINCKTNEATLFQNMS